MKESSSVCATGFTLYGDLRLFSVKCPKIALRHKASVAHKELASLIYLLPAPAGWAPLGVKRPLSFSQVLQNSNIQLVKPKNNATEQLWHFWTTCNFANEFVTQFSPVDSFKLDHSEQTKVIFVQNAFWTKMTFVCSHFCIEKERK